MTYRIFANPDHDWFVAAVLSYEEVTVLYEGHSKERAYEAILDHQGWQVLTREKEMASGSYIPNNEDFGGI